MKLFEKLGVTNNTEDLIDSIVSDISYASHKNISIKTLKEYFGTRNIAVKDDMNIRNVKFKIDKRHNTCSSWLSNSTEITVNVITCKDYHEYMSLYHEYKNSSNLKKYGNKIKGLIEISIFNVEDEYGGWGTYFYNELFDYKILKSILHHELNHLHKSISIKNPSKEYSDAYTLLTDKLKERNMYGTLAYILYVTCIQDERNAHVEQFYREFSHKDPYTSKIYNKVVSFQDEVKFLKRRKNVSSLVNSLYINFSQICKIMFGLTYKDKDDFIDKFIKLLEDNIEKTKKLMHRTMSLYESYDDYVNYYPNRFRRF